MSTKKITSDDVTTPKIICVYEDSRGFTLQIKTKKRTKKTGQKERKPRGHLVVKCKAARIDELITFLTNHKRYDVPA